MENLDIKWNSREGVLKAERLSAAIYLVTEIISDNTLSSKLRIRSLELLSEVITRGQRSRPLVEEIRSLLHIARSAGVVSLMNATILDGEYHRLGELLDQVREPELTFPLVLPEEGASKGHKGQVKDIYKDKKRRALAMPKQNTQRRKTILELLKKKASLTVKDVSSVIANCSEKTLQRELLAMVRDGVLKKEGERRWSRYSQVALTPSATF